MYHSAMSLGDNLRYVDRYGLVTRDFVECSLADRVARSAWGLRLRESFYLNKMQEFHDECDIPPPDIIFDLIWGDVTERAIELKAALIKTGYQIVYVQKGLVRGNSKLFPGRTVRGRVYIAISTSRRN